MKWSTNKRIICHSLLLSKGNWKHIAFRFIGKLVIKVNTRSFESNLFDWKESWKWISTGECVCTICMEILVFEDRGTDYDECKTENTHNVYCDSVQERWLSWNQIKYAIWERDKCESFDCNGCVLVNFDLKMSLHQSSYETSLELTMGNSFIQEI